MTSSSNSKPRISSQENSVGESGFPEALIEDIVSSGEGTWGGNYKENQLDEQKMCNASLRYLRNQVTKFAKVYM